MNDANAYLFAVTNQQCADSGTPPALPEDFATGTYYRSYFENRYGEQWLFWQNLNTAEYQLRGGDYGWERVLTVVAADATDLPKMADHGVDGLALQCALSGKAVVTQILNNSRLPVLFIKDESDELVSLSLDEYLWLVSCVIASRIKLQTLTVPELVTMLKKISAQPARPKKKGDNKDDQS